MIFDCLANSQRYEALNPGFRPAFEYLRTTDFTRLSPGRHEIAGANLFLMLNQGKGRGRTDVKLEAHRQYIDIQYTITGPDEIGWRPLTQCGQIATAYDATKDFMLFADRPEIWVGVPAETFAIFFPEDAHAPMAAPAETNLLKAVLKVAVDWR